jgi:hypothetical protein
MFLVFNLSLRSSQAKNFGFPNVKNCPTRPKFPELVSIEVATQKPTLPPNKVSRVFGTRADGGEVIQKGL